MKIVPSRVRFSVPDRCIDQTTGNMTLSFRGKAGSGQRIGSGGRVPQDHTTIKLRDGRSVLNASPPPRPGGKLAPVAAPGTPRSEEHTSELQSLRHLVC